MDKGFGFAMTKKNKWCEGCSREHELKALEEKKIPEFLKYFKNLW